jgi:hypothetical protein
MPVLTTAFNAYLPWFDLVWILTIVLDIILLRRMAWNTLTRLFSILLSIINIGIAYSLLGNVKNVYTLQGTLEMFKPVFDIVLYFVLIIAIIGSAIKILQMFIRIIRSSTAT